LDQDTLENRVQSLGAADTERKFEIALKRFQALRRHAVERLPRGQGMEAVKEMTEELRTIGP
jgi:hypothetical protein